MEVLFNSELPDHDTTSFETLIEKAFALAAGLEDLAEPWEVSVSFVDDSTIKDLNEQYRGMAAPTDVLSFPQEIDEEFDLIYGMPQILGDIVISLERAMEQAEDYGHPLEREVVFLAVHGFFHLLGYDHETPEEQLVMREAEERVLKELGLGRD